MLHTPASPYASSSVASTYEVKSAPPPPHSAGTHTPKSPRAPARRTVSSGTVAVRSHSAANGAISLRTKSRVVSRMDRCSSLRRLMAPEHSTGAVLPSAPHGPPHRRRRRRRVLARDHAERRARRGGHRAHRRRPPLRRAHRRDGGGLARRRARRRHGGRRAARLQPPRRQPVGHDPDRHGYGPGAQRRARPLVRCRDRRRRQLRHAVRDRARAQARRADRRAAHVAARAAGGAPRAHAARPGCGGRRAPRRRRRATPRRPADAYGLRLKRVAKPEIGTRVRAALALVEIGDVEAVARRKPLALSGGQQQRVALARALVVEPRVLLLDEPLSNLDAKVRQRLRVEVRRLQKAVGITAIYVTHDQEEALAIADTVVLMNAGRVVQSGSPQEIYSRPESAFTAEFLGVSNQLAGIAEAGGVRIGAQRLPYAGAVRGRATLIFRATDASLATDEEEAAPGHALL